jgi:crotonobetaine/carnitine-CoA ligase
MAALTDIALEDRTLDRLWRRAVSAVPDKPFTRWADGARSYAEFDAEADAVAAGLAALGVVPGAKVALMLRNSLEFLQAWFACVKLGAVYVPINTDYKGDILRHQLDRAEVTHIIVEGGFVERLAAVELRHLKHVVTVDRWGAGDAAAGLSMTPFAHLAQTPTRTFDTTSDYRDPLAISFTSGTTGPSKGVLASHCHVISFALDWIEACGFRPDDRLYSPLPMFHAIATWLGVIPCVIQQTTHAFAERFSASRFWDDVRAFDATAVHGIFAMVPMLLKQPERPDDKDVPARIFYIGQRNAAFEQRFNCRIVEVYGATETGIVTYTPLDEAGRPGSCGKPNARTYEVAVVDDADNVVPPGVPGEIVVRPSQPFSMFQGYYGMAEETVGAWRNLWFHTGDNAVVDEDGYLRFADRKKDAIRRRGENISSYELESVLNADPRVAECAAVAHPSELGEDEVRMVIVPADAALTAQDVWALCEDRMPRFWVPRFIEFRDSLPKTPNGKVQKYHLRDLAQCGPIHDRQQAMETAR